MTGSLTTVSVNATIPRPALWLGAFGLLPFIVATMGATIAPSVQETVVAALTAYGAVILSFLGGVLWGIIIGRPASDRMGRLLMLSIIPSLIAWLALLLPPLTALVTLAVSFSCWLFVDRRMAHEKLAPVWYPRLRLPLTTIVVACLAFTALAIA